ncbi:hypothetical protein [Pseudonocardia sp. MH-G8]|nr:hypothetical protein [Pseudonocardia sp. MH-G8]
MSNPQIRPNPNDEQDDPANATEAHLAGTHEPAFPQVDDDSSEDADDE